MNQDLINQAGEILISVLVIGGAGFLLNAHAGDVAITAISSGALLSVTAFWFSQRAAAKASDGTIAAMTNLASQINQASSIAVAAASQTQIAQSAAQSRASVAAVEANRPPLIVPPP